MDDTRMYIEALCPQCASNMQAGVLSGVVHQANQDWHFQTGRGRCTKTKIDLQRLPRRSQNEQIVNCAGLYSTETR